LILLAVLQGSAVALLMLTTNSENFAENACRSVTHGRKVMAH